MSNDLKNELTKASNGNSATKPVDMSKVQTEEFYQRVVESKTAEKQSETNAAWQGFNPAVIFTEEEMAALARKAIEMKVNKATKKAIKASTEDLTLSDAGELIVYTMRKMAQDYIAKKRIDDAIDTFGVTIPQVFTKVPATYKLVESGIVETAANFKTASDALEALDKWYGPASVNVSDKAQLLNCYSKAVGIIKSFFGTASPLK